MSRPRPAAAIRLLLVEDDAVVAAGIQLGLRQHDFVVDWVEDGPAAEKALQSASYTVVVLDLALPREHSLALLEALYRRHDHLPLVVIDTQRPVTADAASAQACDQRPSAFDLEMLATRIRAAASWQQDRAARESAIFALPFSWH